MGHLLRVIRLNWCDKEERDRGREEEGKGNVFEIGRAMGNMPYRWKGEDSVWERFTGVFIEVSALTLLFINVNLNCAPADQILADCCQRASMLHAAHNTIAQIIILYQGFRCSSRLDSKETLGRIFSTNIVCENIFMESRHFFIYFYFRNWAKSNAHL